MAIAKEGLGKGEVLIIDTNICEMVKLTLITRIRMQVEENLR